MDAVSYSLASKQAQRIEKFIENPDSVSGVLTVPKVIAAGETITIPAGRVAVLPNVQVDGTLNISGEVFIPSGATFGDLEAQLALKADTSYVNNKYSGFKNKIINGNFDIWQRGTIFTVAPDAIMYTSDRWLVWNRSNQPLTVEIADNKAFSNLGVSPRMRIAYGIAPTTGDVIIAQRIEDVKRLSSKTFTGSFYHSTIENFNISTYALQNYGTGGSSDTIIVNGSQTTAGDLSFKRYSATFNIPDFKDKTIGNNSFADFTIVAPIRTTKPLSIAQVQLEEGSIATPFEQRPYGLELSLCQRYYEVLGCGIGQVKDASSMILHFSSSEKRVPATAILLNTSPYAESPINIIARNGVSSTIATQMNQNTSKSSGHIVLITGFSSMTAGQSASINAGVIALSAEL